MQQPLEDEYLKRKTTNPPKDPAKGSHENREPPDNPARVTDGQNKKSLEAFITNNFEAFFVLSVCNSRRVVGWFAVFMASLGRILRGICGFPLEVFIF